MSLKTKRYKEKHKLAAINNGEYGYFEVVKKSKINSKNTKNYVKNSKQFIDDVSDKSHSSKHIPVMLNDVLGQIDKYFDKRFKASEKTKDKAKKAQVTIVDVTFGNGGYSEAILERYQDAKLIAFDRDEGVADRAKDLLAKFKDRFVFINDTFSNIRHHILQSSVDIIVADFGVSSMQLDDGNRGFSFQHDASLDMRMDKKNSTTAAKILEDVSQEDLADIIYNFGGERMAKKIASQICVERQKSPIKTTKQLADIVYNCYGSFANKLKIHPATKTFQALRICVNNELEEINTLLSQSQNVLCSGGIFIAVSFHELEDGAVKRFIKDGQNKTKTNKYSSFSKNLNKNYNNDDIRDNNNNNDNGNKGDNNDKIIDLCGVVNVSRHEVLQNVRARSAKMRCFAKNG